MRLSRLGMSCSEKELCQMSVNCGARSLLGVKVVIPHSYGQCTQEVVSALKRNKDAH